MAEVVFLEEVQVAAGSLKKSDVLNLEKKITDIEADSSIEIVPCILKSSDPYPVTYYRSALSFGFFGYIISNYLILDLEEYRIQFTVSFIILGAFLSFVPFIKNFFISKSEKNEEVIQRATQLFYELNIHHTTERNGVLLFVSLLERKVYVLADKIINEKVDPQYWDSIVAIIIEEIKKDHHLNGLQKAMDKIHKDFMSYFPKTSEGRPSEIPDKLITDLKIIG